MVDNDVYKRWLASPYGQVHEQAAKKKQQRELQSSNWHKNPYRILDADDILYPDGAMRKHERIERRASSIFKSRWNMRRNTHFEGVEGLQPSFGVDVERDAIVSLLTGALLNYINRKTTNKQKQVIVLAREAQQRGITPTTYIAQELGIHRKSAWERLKRAKTVTSDHVSDIIVLERKAKKELSRACCWCEQPSPNGLRALCDKCETRFYFLQDYPPGLTPELLQKRINKSNAIHWQKALAA